MDFALRCNSLKCRTQLTERAVVTTCRYKVNDSALRPTVLTPSLATSFAALALTPSA